jgi:glycosyltransferase involved in cell wall biosynthesis
MISDSSIRKIPISRSKTPKEKPRIGIVDEEFPYPANSGKRLRTLNLISRLAKTHEITYVAYRNADPNESMTARTYMERKGIVTIEVGRSVPLKKGLSFYGRLARNLLSDLPYSVTSHRTEEMKQALVEADANFKIELWHCEWTPYAEFFRDWYTCPLVVAAHNVESLIWQRYFETESKRLKRWYIEKQWQKFKSFEKWAFSRADRTIAVSETDRERAIIDFEASTVDVVENGVDTSMYRFNGNKRSTSRMIFLGSLDWRPNTDGLQHFLSTSFKKIIAADPSLVLDIVGRNPPKWLIDLDASHPNVALHANVPDVVPFLCRSTVMIVPLRIGGGSRLKIIEAAANGLPVVSTRVGAEGLDYQGDGTHIVEVESIEKMTQAVLETVNNPETSELMARRARKLTVSHYDWDTLAKKQADVWKSAITGENPVASVNQTVGSSVEGLMPNSKLKNSQSKKA